LADTLVEVLWGSSIISCHCKHQKQEQTVKVIPKKSCTKVWWCLSNESTPPKETPYQALTRFSYQQGKGYLEDVDCDCKDQEPVLLRSDMWSYGKAKNMTVEHNSQTDSNAE
jgi:hypothetical protein